MYFLTHRLGSDEGFPGRGLNPLGGQPLKRVRPVALHHVERETKLAIADGSARFQAGFQVLEELLCRLDAILRALEVLSTLAGRGLHIELFFESLQIARVVVEELLSETRVLEVEDF